MALIEHFYYVEFHFSLTFEAVFDQLLASLADASLSAHSRGWA
jgi:hypothetical protein